MRHIVIINDRAAEVGGASSLAIESARLLAGYGVRVTYFSGDSILNKELESLGVDLVNIFQASIQPAGGAAGLFRGIYNPTTRETLGDWIKNNDSLDTIYHLHGWSKILSPSVFGALKPVSARLVVHAHDYFLTCPNGAFMIYPRGRHCELIAGSLSCLATQCDQRSYTHKLWRFARHAARESLIDLVDLNIKVILIHKTMREHFLRNGFKDAQLDVISNPVTPFHPNRIAAEKNREFIYIGRVVPEKGVKDFLTAARSAQVPARVIGEGSSLQELKDLYPEVKFEGWRNKKEIAEIVVSARALVMPSLYPEPFGLVALEALSSGLPVIASDRSYVADEIHQLACGEKFPAGDLSNLSDIMHRFSISDEYINSMSLRGVENWSKLALTPISWRDKLLSVYQAIWDRSGARNGV